MSRCVLHVLAVVPQVRILQQSFVVAMLRSSNFNKLLSAARETHRMLERSDSLMRLDNGQSLRVREWCHSRSMVPMQVAANTWHVRCLEPLLPCVKHTCN